MNEDLIIWFDNKTCISLTEEEHSSFIKECTIIANKYGLDFSISSSPERMKTILNNIDFEEE